MKKLFCTMLALGMLAFSSTAYAEVITYLGTTPFCLDYHSIGINAKFTDVKNDQGTTEGLGGNIDGGFSLSWAGGTIHSHNDSFFLYPTNDPAKYEMVITEMYLYDIDYSASPTPRSFTANFNWVCTGYDVVHYLYDHGHEQVFSNEYVPVKFESSFSLSIGFIVIPELETCLFILPNGLPDYTYSAESSWYQYTWSFQNQNTPLEGAYAAYARDAFGLAPDSVIYGSDNFLGVWLDLSIVPLSSPTPEPATVLLMGAGLLGMYRMRRRFKK